MREGERLERRRGWRGGVGEASLPTGLGECNDPQEMGVKGEESGCGGVTGESSGGVREGGGGWGGSGCGRAGMRWTGGKGRGRGAQGKRPSMGRVYEGYGSAGMSDYLQIHFC